MADEFTKAALYGIRTFNKKVKEKIGMGKLIALLNEYETPRSGVVYKSYDDYDGFFYGVDCDGETEIAWSDSLICSKKFGWIGWLVENDKIDFRKLDYKNIYMSDYGSSDDIFLAYNKGEQGIIYTVDYYETLLMLLSISDTPIKDLLLYLK